MSIPELRINSPRVHKTIEIATLLYVALPLAIFFWGWLKPVYAAVATVILGLATYLYIRHLHTDYVGSARKPQIITTKRALILVAALLAVWVLMSGTGGLGVQMNDYSKHNAVMSDLTNMAYPTYYSLDGHDKPLVYYFAYYLPAAVLGKLAHSVDVTQLALLAWTLGGVMLCVYWAARIIGRVGPGLILFFILFSGLDFVGFILSGLGTNPFGGNLEWYAGSLNISYSSPTTILFWAPQLAIAAWLFIGWLTALFLEGRSAKNIVFIAALSILWSPFITLGLLPVGIAFLLRNRHAWAANLKGLISFQNLISAPVIIFISVTYLLAASYSQPLQLFNSYPGPGMNGWIKLLLLIMFLFVEFGFYIVLMRPFIRDRMSASFRLLLLLTLPLLIILPFFRYGYANDLVLKVSLPGIFLLFLAVYMYTRTFKWGSLSVRQTIMVAALVLAAITPLVEIRNHLSFDGRHRVDMWQSIGNPDLPPNDRMYANQYVGNKESFFFKNLAP
jgi:hypothetical protein